MIEKLHKKGQHGLLKDAQFEAALNQLLHKCDQTILPAELSNNNTEAAPHVQSMTLNGGAVLNHQSLQHQILQNKA